jgi:phasin family protein
MSDPTTTKAKVTKPAMSTIPPTPEAATEAAREAATPLINMLDQGLARARETHEKMTDMFESASEAFDEAFSTVNRGSAECRMKMMEMARANANATFDMMREMMAARSLPELMELSTTHARRQFEVANQQMKELSELTRKVATESATPLRNGMTETFRQAG